MNSKHTPGPWGRNIKARGKYPIIFAGHNTHVAQACQIPDADELEANITLFAKAPELLECLQTLLDEVAHGQPTVGTVAKGCALIAEIEGGGE